MFDGGSYLKKSIKNSKENKEIPARNFANKGRYEMKEVKFSLVEKLMKLLSGLLKFELKEKNLILIGNLLKYYAITFNNAAVAQSG